MSKNSENFQNFAEDKKSKAIGWLWAGFGFVSGFYTIAAAVSPILPNPGAFGFVALSGISIASCCYGAINVNMSQSELVQDESKQNEISVSISLERQKNIEMAEIKNAEMDFEEEKLFIEKPQAQALVNKNQRSNSF